MMTTEQSRKFFQEYAQALSKNKSEATLDKYIADERLIEHIHMFDAAFPNYQLIPKDIVVEGNKVALRATVAGEHKGELFGIAPTGQKVSVDGLILYELANNKIVNHWMQFDTMSMMQQINSVPAPASE
ncbi:ester cyclase [Pontibacter toksunensis]|uniref:Ester cyclase n=1 Tax=Pontibacter toksunensis TaxID=1332631 RepID=A0ABW6BZS2_9BACT